MDITIEPVTNCENEAEMLRIRAQVFDCELGITLERLTGSDNPDSFHLLARIGLAGDAVAALSVVDTSRNHELHETYGLEFPPLTRVARYTQLAVLRPYRGLNIPLMLMLEAHHRFVAPRKFEYTWLLFDAQRAASSLMCKWLGFAPGKHSFRSEYGHSRALLRDERAPQFQQAIWRTDQCVGQILKTLSSPNQELARPVGSV